MAVVNNIEVIISGPYVSCMGILCYTVTLPKIGCFCYEVIGVDITGNFILSEIK